MDSHDLARYIEATDGIAKPWLLVQMRLKKLEESRSTMSSEAYVACIQDIHQDMMKLGEWWVGQEKTAFNDGLPGRDASGNDLQGGELSPDDRRRLEGL
jgi:hypothetical protein